MFKEWEGSEVFFARVPVLDGSKAYSADGFDAQYAITLLHQRDPSIPRNTGSAFWSGVQENWRKTMNPLTDEQWQQAFEYYKQHVASERAAANRRLVPVTVAIVEAAAQERLHFATLSPDGDYVPSDPRHWRTGDAYARFAECQMNPDAPAVRAFPTIYDVWHNRPDPLLLPGNRWLFVKTDELAAMVLSFQEGDGVGKVSSMSAHDAPMKMSSDSDTAEGKDGKKVKPNYDAEQIANGIRSLVEMWKSGQGRVYGRDSLYRKWRADDGAFPGVTWKVFLAAWNATKNDRPAGWSAGRPRKDNEALPDSASKVRPHN